MDTLITELKRESKYDILILGHVCCQPVGSEDLLDVRTGIKNLSVARAKAVYDGLVLNGIKEQRLAYKGLKSDFPTGKGRYYDRRVEIKIVNIRN